MSLFLSSVRYFVRYFFMGFVLSLWRYVRLHFFSCVSVYSSCSLFFLYVFISVLFVIRSFFHCLVVCVCMYFFLYLFLYFYIYIYI